MIALHWKVTESNRPSAWTCEADTDFIGPIVIRYTFEKEGGGTRYTRQLSNPQRPSDPTEGQLDRMDEEARVGLANIDGESFTIYVEQVLLPTLQPGDIVVMDNLGSHIR